MKTSIRGRFVTGQRRRLINMLLIFSLALFVVPVQALEPAPATVADEIGRVREQLLAAAHAKHPDEIAELFAPDGAMVPGGAGRVSGREAIRGLWKNILSRFTSETTYTRHRVESAGDLAYESGDFAETSVSLASGEKRQVEGIYLMVFKRQPDGRWLILEQILVPKDPR